MDRERFLQALWVAALVATTGGIVWLSVVVPFQLERLISVMGG